MWTGLVTGSMMVVSPYVFKILGWKGVAKATPNFLGWTGVPFFLGCIAYSVLNSGPSTAPLHILVVTGALLQVLCQSSGPPRGPSILAADRRLWLAQVFGKGAKFSLFKPAEEMVYIGLDEESRTKGKAAIDVVGAQTGKSLGSILQQVSAPSFPMSGRIRRAAKQKSGFRRVPDAAGVAGRKCRLPQQIPAGDERCLLGHPGRVAESCGPLGNPSRRSFPHLTSLTGLCTFVDIGRPAVDRHRTQCTQPVACQRRPARALLFDTPGRGALSAVSTSVYGRELAVRVRCSAFYQSFHSYAVCHLAFLH